MFFQIIDVVIFMSLNRKELLIFIISLLISSGLIFTYKIYLEFNFDILILSVIIFPIILAAYFTSIYLRTPENFQMKGHFIYYLGFLIFYTVIGLLLAACSFYDYQITLLYP